jgi:hypothetical protein
MPEFRVKIRAPFVESLHELWRARSSGAGELVDYLSDVLETHAAEHRASRLTHKSTAEPEVFLRDSENFRPVQKRITSAATVQRAIFLLDSGVPPLQVAERLAVSACTVYRIRAQRAIAHDKKREPSENVQRKAMQREA